VRNVKIRILVVTAVSLMTLFPLFGKTYQFELPRATALNGVSLGPGVYKLELNSTRTKAEIFSRGKLAVATQVEVKPLGSATRDTVLIGKTGDLSEYRSSHERILFLSNAPQSSGRLAESSND
jgi:hypothetical protein